MLKVGDRVRLVGVSIEVLQAHVDSNGCTTCVDAAETTNEVLNELGGIVCGEVIDIELNELDACDYFVELVTNSDINGVKLWVCRVNVFQDGLRQLELVV